MKLKNVSVSRVMIILGFEPQEAKSKFSYFGRAWNSFFYCMTEKNQLWLMEKLDVSRDEIESLENFKKLLEEELSIRASGTKLKKDGTTVNYKDYKVISTFGPIKNDIIDKRLQKMPLLKKNNEILYENFLEIRRKRNHFMMSFFLYLLKKAEKFAKWTLKFKKNGKM
jgi:hypothetical protein